MIEDPVPTQKHDRLTAFISAFGLTATAIGPADPVRPANLFIAVEADGGAASELIYHVQGGPPPVGHFGFVASAGIDFGGIDNPLVAALPKTLAIALADHPALKALADVVVDEARANRCGGRSVHDRLCEVIVVMAIRQAIDAGTVNAGLLAGLAHPALHRALVALHDDPARAWRVEDLAERSGLSRSQFIALFGRIVGTTPGAYLTTWRLALGRRALADGDSVKAAAGRVGFGSAAAFSRAFSRHYGEPPKAVGRREAQRPA